MTPELRRHEHVADPTDAPVACGDRSSHDAALAVSSQECLANASRCVKAEDRVELAVVPPSPFNDAGGGHLDSCGSSGHRPDLEPLLRQERKGRAIGLMGLPVPPRILRHAPMNANSEIDSCDRSSR